MIIPDIFADIEFFKTEDGGRKGPTPANFFGCVITIENNNYDARLLLDNVGSIAPGDRKANVPIKFLAFELVFKILRNGSEFLIRDGQVIGRGLVVKIMKV